MKCGKVQRLLPDLADRDMEPGLLRRLEEHLEGCPACREQAESLRKLHAVMTGDPAPEVPLPSGPQAAAWILHQDRERSRRWWARVPTARTACRAAGLALTLAVVAAIGDSLENTLSPAPRPVAPAPAAPLPALIVVDDEDTGRQVLLAPAPAAAPDHSGDARAVQ